MPRLNLPLPLVAWLCLFRISNFCAFHAKKRSGDVRQPSRSPRWPKHQYRCREFLVSLASAATSSTYTKIGGSNTVDLAVLDRHLNLEVCLAPSHRINQLVACSGPQQLHLNRKPTVRSVHRTPTRAVGFSELPLAHHNRSRAVVCSVLWVQARVGSLVLLGLLRNLNKTTIPSEGAFLGA